MPLLLCHSFYSSALCQRHPEKLFVFGDNFQRAGTGGQAVIRGEPNALGLATKLRPGGNDGDYLSDGRDEMRFTDELERVGRVIAEGMRQQRAIVWPADGLGTGLADLPARSPRLYTALCRATQGWFQSFRRRPSMHVVVCGGRSYADEGAVAERLQLLAAAAQDSGASLEVMEGGCSGADRLASNWVQQSGLPWVLHTRVPAAWKRFGKRAGYYRNREMGRRLVARRDQVGGLVAVVAFPGGDGTAMMCGIAEGLRLRVLSSLEELSAWTERGPSAEEVELVSAREP